MARGQDCALWDTDGKEYLDATGGLWLAQIGHGRDEVAAVAAEQISTLEYFTSFWVKNLDVAFKVPARSLVGLRIFLWLLSFHS
jgi:putrescine aminotransferase